MQAERDAIEIPQEAKVEEYLALTQQLTKLTAERAAFINAPKYALPFLQPGRLVQVAPAPEGSGEEGSPPAQWALVVNFKRAGKNQDDGSAGANKSGTYVVDVLANCTEESSSQGSRRYGTFA